MSGHLAAESIKRVTGEVPVLMYHSIARDASAEFRRFAVDPDEFGAQMDYLAAEGYQTVTAADLAADRAGRAGGAGRPLPPRPIVLTFDDAYTDFYSTALPILREHDFRASLYVPTAYIGATARFLGRADGNRAVLSWQALRDVAAEGVEVAAHSHTHPQLDRVPAAVIREEVRCSRRLLEDQLGLAVPGFAYPFGYWNRAARAAVAAAGYGYACAVAELITAPGDDVLSLPRLTVNAGIGVAGLTGLLDTRPARAGRQMAEAKRLAWRALRRMVPALGGDPQEGRPFT